MFRRRGKKFSLFPNSHSFSIPAKHFTASLLTVFDSKNWIAQFLQPAVDLEKQGKIGLFYFDHEKAEKYNATRALVKRLTGSDHTPGILHKITDIGIKLKPQTETLQFKKYFGDWQDHPEKASKVVRYNRAI
jgi:hypothetical protein